MYIDSSLPPSWNIFDTFIVICSFVDIIVLLRYDNQDQIGTIAMFRMLRIIRVFRTVKLLRYCKSLWLLCHGLVAAFRTIAWIAVLLFILIYGSAIFLTRLIGQNAAYVRTNKDIGVNFGTVGDSMYSLFTVLTLEKWPDIANPVVKAVGPGMA